MNIEQLRSFIQVANAESISRAARENFISAQALTQQINLLEKKVGTPLFRRGAGGVKLTMEGEALYRRAEQIIELEDLAMAEVHHQGTAEDEVVRVGIPAAPPIRGIMRTCRRLEEIDSDIQIALVSMGSGARVEALVKRWVDVCMFMESPELKRFGLGFTKLYDSSLYCLMSAKHKLAKRRLLHMDDLIGEDVYAHRLFIYERIIKENPEVSFKEFLKTSSRDTAWREAADALDTCHAGGVLIVLEEPEYYHEALVKIPLDHSCDIGVGVAYHPDLSEAAKRFIALTQEVCEDGLG